MNDKPQSANNTSKWGVRFASEQDTTRNILYPTGGYLSQRDANDLMAEADKLDMIAALQHPQADYNFELVQLNQGKRDAEDLRNIITSIADSRALLVIEYNTMAGISKQSAPLAYRPENMGKLLEKRKTFHQDQHAEIKLLVSDDKTQKTYGANHANFQYIESALQRIKDSIPKYPNTYEIKAISSLAQKNIMVSGINIAEKGVGLSIISMDIPRTTGPMTTYQADQTKLKNKCAKAVAGIAESVAALSAPRITIDK